MPQQVTIYDDADVFRELSKWYQEGKVNELLFQFFKKEFETTGKMPLNSAMLKELGFKKIETIVAASLDLGKSMT